MTADAQFDQAFASSVRNTYTIALDLIRQARTKREAERVLERVIEGMEK